MTTKCLRCGRFVGASPCCGIKYDEDTGRFVKESPLCGSCADKIGVSDV